MLPFRSGRAGILGCDLRFFALVLSCAALAGETNTQARKGEATTKPKARPKPEEGLTNIPIAGRPRAKGLGATGFRSQGTMRGKLEAGMAKRLDDEHVEFQRLEVHDVHPETETPDLDNRHDHVSIFNLKTQMITSSSAPRSSDRILRSPGTRCSSKCSRGKGTLAGNVKMVIHGKSRAAGKRGE